MKHYIAHCEACGRDFTGQAETAPKDDEIPCPACGSHKVEVCAHGDALTLDEAMRAIDKGRKVWWVNYGYECYKGKHGDYLCTFKYNGNTVGLRANGERGFFTHD